MPDIPDSQGGVVTFRGDELGVLVGVTPAFAVGNVAEVTNMRSPLVGAGQNARVLKQFTCTSIEPGQIQVRFLGVPDLARDDIGGPGTLVFSWATGQLSGQAFLSQLEAEFAVGDLIKWNATFQFTGFDQ